MTLCRSLLPSSLLPSVLLFFCATLSSTTPAPEETAPRPLLSIPLVESPRHARDRFLNTYGAPVLDGKPQGKVALLPTWITDLFHTDKALRDYVAACRAWTPTETTEEVWDAYAQRTTHGYLGRFVTRRTTEENPPSQEQSQYRYLTKAAVDAAHNASNDSNSAEADPVERELGNDARTANGFYPPLPQHDLPPAYTLDIRTTDASQLTLLVAEIALWSQLVRSCKKSLVSHIMEKLIPPSDTTEHAEKHDKGANHKDTTSAPLRKNLLKHEAAEIFSLAESGLSKPLITLDTDAQLRLIPPSYIFPLMGLYAAASWGAQEIETRQPSALTTQLEVLRRTPLFSSAAPQNTADIDTSWSTPEGKAAWYRSRLREYQAVAPMYQSETYANNEDLQRATANGIAPLSLSDAARSIIYLPAVLSLLHTPAAWLESIIPAGASVIRNMKKKITAPPFIVMPSTEEPSLPPLKPTTPAPLPQRAPGTTSLKPTAAKGTKKPSLSFIDNMIFRQGKVSSALQPQFVIVPEENSTLTIKAQPSAAYLEELETTAIHNYVKSAMKRAAFPAQKEQPSLWRKVASQFLRIRLLTKAGAMLATAGIGGSLLYYLYHSPTAALRLFGQKPWKSTEFRLLRAVLESYFVITDYDSSLRRKWNTLSADEKEEIGRLTMSARNAATPETKLAARTELETHVRSCLDKPDSETLQITSAIIGKLPAGGIPQALFDRMVELTPLLRRQLMVRMVLGIPNQLIYWTQHFAQQLRSAPTAP